MSSEDFRCSFSATGGELHHRYLRHFVFTKCPVLKDGLGTAVFRAGSALCISGPCSSGKTLVAMHALADIVSSYGMAERAIYMDFDLSFDLDVFKRILRSHAKGHFRPSKVEAEVDSALDRLVYIPVYHIRDVPALLIALDVYIQSMNIRILVIDSLLSKQGGISGFLIDPCLDNLRRLRKKHNLMVIYTKHEESGYTLPISVKVDHRDPLSQKRKPQRKRRRKAVANDTQTVELTIGIPIHWLNLPSDIATNSEIPPWLPSTWRNSTVTEDQKSDQNHVLNSDIKNLQDSRRLGNQDFRQIGSHDIRRLGTHDIVTVHLLPPRRRLFEPLEYLGCIYKLHIPYGLKQCNYALADHLRKRLPVTRKNNVSMSLPQGQHCGYATYSVDSRAHNHPDTRTILSTDSEQHVGVVSTRNKVIDGAATLASTGLPVSLARTRMAINAATLNKLRFSLFTINEEQCLHSQKFSFQS
ncbi:hypothetical protein BaOVIS_021810 [Babesia ovis]|uniref:DNA recombination and repair protein Rad51-like C-terminal domain-containing protein n=1 Tax=Babesia ovis TaxID=5869 RepID=A0A9W5WVX4_BABOV|nr:hypothetical protein BaOVIS_021810 [Babesia ovis]